MFQSAQYMLTLELGNNCTSEDTCSGGRHICETDVLDEPWNKKRVLVEDKTKCAEREPNSPVEFVGMFSYTTCLLQILKSVQIFSYRDQQHNCYVIVVG